MTASLIVLRRLVRIAFAFLCAWLIARVVAPWLRPERRQQLAVVLSRGLLWIVGVRPELQGTVPHEGPRLLVANHVSWLDVQLLNGLGPSRFVAKAETRGWPVCGGIASAFDTFFIDRGSVRDAGRVKARIAAALRAGQSVTVFPEGTTTDGDGLGRFYAALFEAAIETGVPVQPVAIRYPDTAGAANPAAAFVDDMTFVESLVRIAREPRLRARLTFGPTIATRGRSRRDVAADARRRIGEALGLPMDGSPAEHVARMPPPEWRAALPAPDRERGPRIVLRRRPRPVRTPAAA